MAEYDTQKRVYKYGTGEPIPKGAVYLNTVAQTAIPDSVELGAARNPPIPCWLVWHYFLVEVRVPA